MVNEAVKGEELAGAITATAFVPPFTVTLSRLSVTLPAGGTALITSVLA